MCTCVNSLAKGRRSKKGSHPHQSTANSFSLSYLHILAASRSVAPIYELHLYIYIVQETLIFFSRSLPPSSSPAFSSKLWGSPNFSFFFFRLNLICIYRHIIFPSLDSTFKYYVDGKQQIISPCLYNCFFFKGNRYEINCPKFWLEIQQLKEVVQEKAAVIIMIK